jgi:hypothetical protein
MHERFMIEGCPCFDVLYFVPKDEDVAEFGVPEEPNPSVGAMSALH